MSGSGDANPSLLANYNFFAFSTATLNDILCKFSEPNYIKVAITYACMVSWEQISNYFIGLYVCVCFISKL